MSIVSKIVIVQIVLSLIFFLTSQAQQVVGTNYLLLNKQHLSNLHAYQTIKTHPNTALIVDSLFQLYSSKTFKLDSALITAEYEQAKRNNGLHFTAYTNHNFKAASIEESEPVSKSRIRAGLEYDVLNNGWAEKKQNLKRLSNKKRILELDELILAKQNNYGIRFNSIIYLCNRDKIQILEKRYKYLEEWQDILLELYSTHHISYNKYLDFKDKQEESTSTCASYKTYNAAFEKLIHDSELKSLLKLGSLPVFDIQLDSLLKSLEADSTYKEKTALQLNNLMLQEKTKKNLRLKLGGYWNFSSKGTNARSYPSLSASFSMPLQVGNSRKELGNAKIEQLKNEVKQEQFHLSKEIINHYYEYRYTLKQFSNYQYILAMEQEKLRVHQLQKEPIANAVQDINLMQQVDNIAAIELEILDIKKQLYLKLLKIHTLVPMVQPSDYLFKNEHGGNSKRANAIFANIADFTKGNIPFYANYLQKIQIKEIIFTGKKPQEIAITSALRAEGFSLSYMPNAGEKVNGLELLSGLSLYEANQEVHIIDVTTCASKKELKEKIEKTKTHENIVLKSLKDLMQLEKTTMINGNRYEKL